jgi:uncharacterized membrane protein YgdD (TMEM256/DUF423 family)
MCHRECFAAWRFCLGDCFGFVAVQVFFATQILRRERKVLCSTRGAVFEIGTLLFFGSLQKRLRGGRLLFPLRRKK